MGFDVRIGATALLVENQKSLTKQVKELNMNRKGIVFIFAAPSGSGKTTLAREVVKDVGDIRISISHTTRPSRGNEVDGRDYYFVSSKEFSAMERAGKFLENARVHDNHYATSIEEVLPYLERGIDVILDIDVKGSDQTRGKIEVVSIFILPPDMEELQRRLENRDTDDAGVIEKRLVNARQEIREVFDFDYVVVNRTIEEALSDIKAIIMAERSRVTRNRNFLEAFIKKSVC